MMRMVGLAAVVAASSSGQSPRGLAPRKRATVSLVESMPTGMPGLPALPNVGSTGAAQAALLYMAKESVDVTVMYWNLLASGVDGQRHFTPAELAALGAGEGERLYAAFMAAAARGVRIRILNCRGASLCRDDEAIKLQARFPELVSIRYWNASEWYGGGIMHQKIWVVDKLHVYVGSANMDWLSLAQVKELGAIIQNSSKCG